MKKNIKKIVTIALSAMLSAMLFTTIIPITSNSVVVQATEKKIKLNKTKRAFKLNPPHFSPEILGARPRRCTLSPSLALALAPWTGPLSPIPPRKPNLCDLERHL